MCNTLQMTKTYHFANLFLRLAAASIGIGTVEAAEMIYSNGEILTMVTKKPTYAEALVVDGGKIEFVGSKKKAMKLKTKDTKLVNLGGKTLVPGFIDTHGHFLNYGKNLIDADLLRVTDIAELLTRMKTQAAKVPPGNAWIVGFGYLARNMKERRFPTMEELDSISRDRPVLAIDQSGHAAAGNSALFKLAGITAETPDPEGGIFERKADRKSLTGTMEETALNLIRAFRPAFTGQLALDVIINAAGVWMENGQTTAMECAVGVGNDDVDILRNAVDKNILPIDLYLCAKDTEEIKVVDAAKKAIEEYKDAGEVSSEFDPEERSATQGMAPGGDGAKLLLAARPDLDKRYINHVRLGGLKFWIDGGLPTAFMREPFTTNPPGKTGQYKGYAGLTQETLDAAFDKYWTTSLQIHTHMQGDAAADMVLSAIQKAVKKYGKRDARPVFVHAVLLQPDQIQKMKEFGAVPSFLLPGVPAGIDYINKLWGPKRANKVLATQTMVNEGLPFSLSHDAPIFPRPNLLEQVEIAVNRASPTGAVLGPDQRISAYNAMRAITAWGAYTLKEETSKGTLEVGKLADLVILDANPLKVGKASIGKIKVLETIKEGKIVFKR